MNNFEVESIRSVDLCPRVEELLLKRDGRKIPLRIFLPPMFNKNEKHPTLCVPSARSTFNPFRPFGVHEISKVLSLGIVAFSFTNELGLKGMQTRVPTWRDDLHAVLKYIYSLPYVDKDNIGIISFSSACIPVAACLAEYPDDPPVKYWIDGEGPSDRYVVRVVIAGTEWDMDRRDERAKNLGDDDFWMPGEAFRYMDRVKCRYLRLQGEKDHVQGWFYGHAIQMLNAAVRGGSCPWVRCNSGPVNIIHRDGSTLDLLPGRLFEHADRFIRYLLEMIRMPPLANR